MVSLLYATVTRNALCKLTVMSYKVGGRILGRPRLKNEPKGHRRRRRRRRRRRIRRRRRRFNEIYYWRNSTERFPVNVCNM
jgi:hypothetical protein